MSAPVGWCDDPHEEVHRIVDIHPVRGAGWVVLVQQSVSDRHQIIALSTAAEGAPIEILDCTTDDVPHPSEEWGLASDRVADMIAHAVWHAATGTPPNHCPETHDG